MNTDEDFVFSSLELINQENNLVQFIVDMVHDGTLMEYPRSENVTTVRVKRRKIEQNMIEILDQYDTQCRESPNKSSLYQKQPSAINNNMQRFKIINSSLTSMHLKFVEVSARVCPGGGKYKTNVTSNRISSIKFEGTLQKLVEEKLMANLEEDLKINHNVSLEGSGTIAMYVNKHSPVSCTLPCKRILQFKPDLYKEECLSQRITLGSYYYPYVDNNNIEDEDSYSGILGNLLIHNNVLFGIGHPKNSAKDTDTFVDTIEMECPDPVQAIISCSLYEVGVYAKKTMILYLKPQDRVFYANKQLNEMKSARSVVIDILKTCPRIKGKVRIECARQGKELPDDIEIDYGNQEIVDQYIQNLNKKRKYGD